MKKLETIAILAFAALVGCETPQQHHRRKEQPVQAYEPPTIRLEGHAQQRRPQERITVIMNEQYPNGAEIHQDGTIRAPVIAPIGTLTVIPPRISYPSGVPKGWNWEQQGNWYRSPDRRFLWIDGAVRQSLEGPNGKRDYELIPHGSQEYAPRTNR